MSEKIQIGKYSVIYENVLHYAGLDTWLKKNRTWNWTVD